MIEKDNVKSLMVNFKCLILKIWEFLWILYIYIYIYSKVKRSNSNKHVVDSGDDKFRFFK